MLRRILVASVVTAGLLAAAGPMAASAAVARPGKAPKPAATAWLYGVDALSPTDAWAVGGFGNLGGAAPLVYHWNGHTWGPSLIGQNITENADNFFGVAATSARNVWAAGATSSQYAFPLVQQWNGSKWLRNATPTPGADGGAAIVGAVAATSASDAWAVGGYFPGLDGLTMILRWENSKWVQVPSPSPGGQGSSARSNLTGVTALSPTDAWAVGSATTGQAGAATTTVIEHWNGAKWATVPSPDPTHPGCDSDELLGVASSAAATWAVGSECGLPLVLRLTASGWQQVPAPAPPKGSTYQLSAVSVTSATNAWAAGTISGKRPLTLHWNGTKWLAVTSPTPRGAESATLSAVTATGSTAWAAGTADYASGAQHVLIERWIGTRWKLDAVPNPTP
jgi:hypothetical protein